MRLYKSKECVHCGVRDLCTRNKNGRIIYRWEYEEILEEMRERVRTEKEKVKLRNLLIEHIFGTIKRNFNQGYMLLKGKDKVSAEMALTVLAYNVKRVLNILGPEKLIGITKAMNKGIYNNLEDIFVKFYYFLQKITNFILYWLNPVQKGVIYV